MKDRLNVRGFLLGMLVMLVPMVCLGATSKIRDYQIAFGTPSVGNVSFDDFTDVNLSGQANLDLLSYESASSSWKPKSYATLGLTNYWQRDAITATIRPATAQDILLVQSNTAGAQAILGQASNTNGVGIYGYATGSGRYGVEGINDTGASGSLAGYFESSNTANDGVQVKAADGIGLLVQGGVSYPAIKAENCIALKESGGVGTGSLSGYGQLYFKSSDSRLYYKTDGAVEYGPLDAGSSGLGDPGSNGIVARTALNTTAARTLGVAYTGPTDVAFSWTNPTGAAGNPALNATVNAQTRSVTIPVANCHTPGALAGAADLGMAYAMTETGAADTCYFSFQIPDNYNGSTFAVILEGEGRWSGAPGGPGNAYFTLDAGVVADGAVFPTGYGASQVTVTSAFADTVPTKPTTYEKVVFPAITPNGTLTAGDIVVFKMARNSGNAADTTTSTFYWTSTRIEYGVGALTE